LSREPSEIAISVVVPLFNEEACTPLLYERITAVMATLGARYEIIFVDDGSRDDTFAIARDLAGRDERLRVVKFRRNFGQTPAMAAGIEQARGRVIVTMDGDLQNDPADIPRLVRGIEAGHDIVVGWRRRRKDRLLTRRIPSRVANWLIGKVTGVAIRDNGCSLKAYRADVIRNVALYSEMHRFIPAMADVTGARVREISVRHHARRFGESKYGLSRIWKVLIDLVGIATIRSVSRAPVRWFAWLAVPFMLIGTAVSLVALAAGAAAGGAFSVVFAATGLTFLSLSVSLLFYGMLVELLMRTGDVDTRSLLQKTSRVL
jgi:glycosyltransferase involved in cell wall biosynthesis